MSRSESPPRIARLPHRPASALYWPTATHLRLLQAFGPDVRHGMRAWADWLGEGHLDSVEPDVFQLLPSFFLHSRDELDVANGAKLRGIYRYAWLHDQLARRQLLRIVLPLEREGLQPILLDGATLALFHYPDPGARPFWSLEFLVREEDLTTIARVLSGTDWTPVKRPQAIHRRPFRPGVSYRFPPRLEMTFTAHPLLAAAPPSFEEAFRVRAVSRALEGITLQVPEPTDLLLATCLRGRLTSPQGACLWVLDALTLLRTAEPSIDWPALGERARTSGALPAVRDALTFLRIELDARIPDAAIAELWSIPASSAETKVYQELLDWNRPRLRHDTPLGRRWRHYRRAIADRISNASGGEQPAHETDRPRFVCYFGHHRAASTYTHHVIQAVCRELGWPFSITHSAEAPGGSSVRLGIGDSPRFLIYTNAEVSLLRALGDCRGFHVIRDPRDIVVSSYFSHRYSHPTKDWQALVEHRRQLESLSKDDGLLNEIETCRREQFTAMHEWDYSSPNVLEVRMEDLVRSPYEAFLRVFRFLDMIDEDSNGGRRLVLRALRVVNRTLGRVENAVSLRLRHRPVERPLGKPLRGIPPARLLAIVGRHEFAKKTGGRVAGEEDVKSHYRKGIAGDWRNHFKDVHVEAFKANYNDLLVKLGYESDDRW